MNVIERLSVNMQNKIFKFTLVAAFSLCFHQGIVHANEANSVSSQNSIAESSDYRPSENELAPASLGESSESMTSISDQDLSAPVVISSSSKESLDVSEQELSGVESEASKAANSESESLTKDETNTESGKVSLRSPGNVERHYTIKSGDSLWLIANKFGLTLDELLKLNGFANTSVMLHPGQLIKVSASKEAAKTEPETKAQQPGNPQEYIIQSGDSLWRISQRYRITLDELMKWNNFASLNVMLHPGQKIIVSRPQVSKDTPKQKDEVKKDESKKDEPKNQEASTYTIQSGDSFWKIANQFGMSVDELLKLNGYSSANVMIHPGQVLKVKSQSATSNPKPSPATSSLPRLTSRYYQALSAAQKQFLNKITPAAVNGWDQYKILPSVTLGQAIIESAWGSSPGAIYKNNYFGVMDSNGSLRRYASVEEGFKHRFEFLQHYRGVAGNRDYRSTLRNIHAGGYAEAPDYAQSLINLIEQYGLQVYDTFVLNK